MLKHNNIDIAVALIFFNRPNCLEESFKAVKKARPSKLFLIQDGARSDNKQDLKNIDLCRQIVDNIDWDCQIVRDYADENLGCGLRVYTGISNAFKVVEQLIILEDDCVANQDFFLFCKDNLEYYKNDTRIHMVCGMNNLGKYNTPYSYVFSLKGSICGWATWKRQWEQVQYNFDFLEDSYAVNNFLVSFPYKKIAKQFIKTGLSRKRSHANNQALTSWSYQLGVVSRMNGLLNITSKVNLISNIGVGPEATNGGVDLKLIPRGIRRIFYLKTHRLNFPLKHPKYVLRDVSFDKKIYRLMGNGHPLVNLYRMIEKKIYILWYKIF